MPRKRLSSKKLTLRIHQTVARDLGTDILLGRLKPDQGLGTEIDEAERLGVSRTAYREAIRILVSKGLLESRPRAGTRVTPRSRWNKLDPEILEWMFVDNPDRSFVRDLFQLRALIEPEAAALAARNHGPEDLAEMDRGLRGMKRYGITSEKGQEADQRFHAAILTATGNELLETLSSSIGAAVRWTTHFKERKGKIARDTYPEHKRLRDAIAASDPDAAREAMTILVQLALLDMGEWSQARPEPEALPAAPA